MTMKPRPLAVRFWERVEKTAACWLWTGYINRAGYGTIGAGGRNATPLKAHRVSWEIHNGPIPGDLCVLHRCDNPRCVRPAHLFLGTRADNAADRGAKGRTGHGVSLGTANGGAVLTNRIVREIRRLATAGATNRDIAARFGVAPSLVSMVKTGKRWTHVK